LAEYRDRQEELRKLGVEVAALSADAVDASERLWKELHLPFPLLCDPERKVITAWGLLNPRMLGGVAHPAIFVLDPGLRVRYRSLDGAASRVQTGGLLELLRGGKSSGAAEKPRRVPVLAGPMDWWRGIRNYRARR
jgi:peroxiredoxin